MTPQYIEINSNGSKFYYNDKAMKILHREDGPAIEGSNGDKEWWLMESVIVKMVLLLKIGGVLTTVIDFITVDL